MKTNNMMNTTASTKSNPDRHSRENGNPVKQVSISTVFDQLPEELSNWISAFARMTSMLVASLMLFIACVPVGTVRAAQVETAYMTAARYNPAGQLTGTIKPDPDGGGPLRLLSTRNTYDPATGLLTKVESGELGVWQDESTQPANWAGFTIFSTTVISYDSYGRKVVEKMIGRDGSTTESLVQYTYDTANHVWCKAIRLNKAAFGSLPADACTQGTAGNDGPDRIYRYTYDYLDQVLTEERGVGTSLQETYATNTYGGRELTSQTDANGNYTKLTYDAYARLQYRYYPSKTTAGSYNTADYNQYTYDGNGNVTVERKRNTTTVTNTYDANNRLILKDLSDNTYSPDIYYDYDARGLMLHSAYSSDSGAGIYTTYDGFGRIVTSTNTMGGTSRALNYQYDNNGNRTRITHPDGWFFQYGFDGLNRINALNESTAANSGAGTSSLLTVVYRQEGIPFYVSRNNGVSITSIPAQSTTPSLSGLDNANRVQNLFHDFPGTTNDLTNTFTYNAASQIIQLDQSNNTYSYVGNDNKTGAYGVNGLNQYTSINGATINYDTNGNETFDGTNNTTYTYDMENHLVATSGGVTSSFVYDPQGRLFQSTITANGTTTTTQFLYDNTALVAEYVGGAVSKRYVHGDQVDQPLVQYVGSSVSPAGRQYLHADHQGSIIALSDNAGNVISKYTYDNFGIPGNAIDYRFAYTGQIWFRDLKLFYYKARFYSPYQGRFMQTDPIFYKDDMDLYSYVGNDPMDKKDPTGTTVELTGSTADVDKFVKLAAQLTGLKLSVKNGHLTIAGGANSKSGNSVAAQRLTTVVNSKSQLQMNIVNNEKSVVGDSFADNKVDVADLGAFASKSNALGAAVLTHIVTERAFDAARHNGTASIANYGAAHRYALTQEAKAIGNGAVTRFDYMSSAPNNSTDINLDYVNSSGNTVSSYSVNMDNATGELK